MKGRETGYRFIEPLDRVLIPASTQPHDALAAIQQGFRRRAAQQNDMARLHQRDMPFDKGQASSNLGGRQGRILAI